METATFQIIQIIIATLLGGIIGIEREEMKKPAGLRTHMLVSMGACLFVLSSKAFSIDPARIAAGIVTGIGFIGAGCIIAHGDKVVGVSTAASLWVTAGIGLLVGIGEFIIPATATLITIFILHVGLLIKKFIK